jgi:hypothetical protein
VGLFAATTAMTRWTGVPSIAVAALLATTSTATADVTKQQCMTENEAAQELQRAGRLLEAREHLATCLSDTCPGPVREDCVQRLADIDRAQPTIVFDAKDRLGHDVAEVAVTVDGRPFASRLDGRALPVDPGEHTFRFEMAGQPPTTQRLIVKEGQKDRRERIIVGSPPPEEQTPATVPASSPQTAPDQTAPATPSAERTPDEAAASNGQRVAGLAIGVGGLAALGVGVGFAAVTSSKWSSAQSKCGSPATCTDYAGAVADHDSAVTAATVSTIGLIGGGALLLGGAILYLTAPTTPRASTASLTVLPSVWSGGGGMLMRTRF